MPVIEDDVLSFAQGKNAKTIDPFPSKGPDQRGPTCGFYALGFVLQYWFERQSARGDSGVSGLAAPLPPRTKTGPGPAPMTREEKQAKNLSAFVDSEFTSLRHYGKYNKLTVYGSVFNSESLVKIAQGQGAQYYGQFDGRVIHTTDPADLVAKAKRFLEQKCPLIIPFGVGEDGDPLTENAGEHAHWAVLVGSYTVPDGGDYFIHYHWGKYRFASALLFAASNHNLTSNRFAPFQKVELTKADGSLFREYVGQRASNRLRLASEQGKVDVRYRGAPKSNLEFNNPGVLKPNQIERFGPAMEEHGFDSQNLVNAGLMKNLVAVYPVSLRDKMATL